MFQDLPRRRTFILFGTLFGAWLGGIYALATQAVNWIAMPGVPLTPPYGDLNRYIFEYVLIGAALGLITSLPSNSAAGTAAGGIFGSFAISMVSVVHQWESGSFVQTLIVLFYTFLPLIVLLMPLAFLVRKGADAQQIDPDRPYLWARRILVPFVLTLVFTGLGAFSLHSKEIRDAFHFMDAMVRESSSAQSVEALPGSLHEVKGYLENAKGPYSHAWSDRVETFMGPQPVTGILSQFLIITTFDNGFSFACIFSRTTTVPNCTNY